MADVPKANPVRNAKTNNARPNWGISNGANAVVGSSSVSCIIHNHTIRPVTYASKCEGGIL